VYNVHVAPQISPALQPAANVQFEWDAGGLESVAGRVMIIKDKVGANIRSERRGIRWLALHDARQRKNANGWMVTAKDKVGAYKTRVVYNVHVAPQTSPALQPTANMQFEWDGSGQESAAGNGAQWRYGRGRSRRMVLLSRKCDCDGG
jgi:hypothetical protein